MAQTWENLVAKIKETNMFVNSKPKVVPRHERETREIATSLISLSSFVYSSFFSSPKLIKQKCFLFKYSNHQSNSHFAVQMNLVSTFSTFKFRIKFRFLASFDFVPFLKNMFRFIIIHVYI